MSKFEEITGMKISAKQVKIGFYSFGAVFVISLFTLKPFLASAIYHNFANIDDYQIFSNREVKISQPQPWEMSPTSHPDPEPKTQELLDQLKTTALIVIDGGKISYEKYFLSGGVDVISGSFSMAKSIVGMLTGFALQEGAIPSLDSEIKTWITEWTDRPEGNLTVRELLTMSSGLNWNESYWNPFSITTEAYYGSTILHTALKQRLVNEPGKVFSYQSGTTQLLGIVVSRAVNKSLSRYASEKLWQPLGAEKIALWSIDHPENLNEATTHPSLEKAYCCFNARARDFAKIGQLVLQQGQWNGKTLLDTKFVQEMTSGKVADYYGYQWWVLDTPQGKIPYARGILGQYIMVIPQKNRVIVRLGMKTAERINHHPIEVRALAEWALKN
jgi:CubicO group peptidase (beta-lactamase class C family)